ncbi:unnamed protein product [Adineta steineri]|uniref:Uncharacterized protein n=1 Tax=Adineta steineri TaxID=433720 RepID=A0A813YEF4_9BILA|nr:unnamed protein product [Adineta steineri]CAF0885367.1 unnamed protein product [Adineta steineri]
MRKRRTSSTNDRKDEKLNGIIKFIQDKILTLFDEDLILKFFGQKNSSSTDKEKHRNWFIDIYISLRKLLCDISKINDRKLSNFHYKYNLMKKSYGRAWKLFLEQIEEKSSSQQQEYDNKLLHVNQFIFIYFVVQSSNEYEIFNYVSRTFNSS